MRSATRGAHRAALLLLVPVLIAAFGAAPAAAQDPVAAARLVLAAIPVAHGPDDGLGVRLRVLNTGEEPIDGFRLTVGAGAAVASRSELHATFESYQPFTLFPLDFQGRRIDPGERETVEVDTPVADLVDFSDGGVHPLSFSLYSADDSLTPLDTLTTQLMTYPSPPEEPLNLVPVLPLNDAPARAPDGTYPADDDAANPLEAAVGERGWLRALILGIDAATAAPPEPEAEPPREERQRERDEPSGAPPLRLGFAPTPLLVEELAALTDGFVRSTDEGVEEVEEDAAVPQAAAELLDILRDIVRRESVQPILVPYSFPDLPTIEEELSAADIGVQLTEASTSLDQTLGLRLDRGWVFPPAGRLDATSLEALQTAGVTDGVFFAGDALDDPADPNGPGCPIPYLSFVCSVRVSTDVGGAIGGYVFDDDLQARLTDLSRPGGGRLEIQRVFAETAMVHAEQPGSPGRVIHMTIPTSWHPNPRLARTLFEGLRDAPWLATATPEEGLDRAESPVERTPVDDAATLPQRPDEEYFAQIVDAQEMVQSFSSFVADREPRGMLRRLRRNVLVGEGRTMWTDPAGVAAAAAYVEDAHDEARAEMGKVTLGVPSQTTFTSRTGSLDLSLFNETGYRIDARVVLRSLDMEFSPATIDRAFPPGTTRLSIEAEAQTSGTFPIEVRAETADGYAIAVEAVQVQSTEFNVVAVAITLGAVAFLVLFYLVKAIKRRRRAIEAASS